jgi:hypothetical protein
MTNDTLTHLEFLNARSDRQHVFVGINDPKHSYQGHTIGTLHTSESRLDKWNSAKCGVFVQIHHGLSRRAVDVLEAHTLFLDFDGFNSLPELPYVPSLTVKTKRGYHVYWKLTPTSDISAWKETERGLAKALGADPAATAINQIARLAGYDHHKAEPFRVHIEDATPGLKYSLNEFADFRAFTAPVNQIHVLDGIKPVRELDFALRRQILRNATSKVRAATKGHRYNTLRRQAYHLGTFGAYGIPLDLSLNHLMSAASNWSDCDLPRFRRDMFDVLLDGARDAVHAPPYIPTEQLANWDCEDKQAEFLEALKDSPIPICLSLDEVLDCYPTWNNCFKSERQAKLAIADLLRDLGYSRSRCRNNRALMYKWHLSKPVPGRA